MGPTQLLIHACEQVLRFTRAATWNDLSEERKVQLGFNTGIMALGLNLSKDEGYLVLVKTREGQLSMPQLHAYLRDLVAKHQITVSETNIQRSF
ncbi:MAG: hypothetical protein INF43_05350 [Alphaproteobacteria bacterium]|nr:hypothetical protein [Alphaproteobacteria bacterium]